MDRGKSDDAGTATPPAEPATTDASTDASTGGGTASAILPGAVAPPRPPAPGASDIGESSTPASTQPSSTSAPVDNADQAHDTAGTPAPDPVHDRAGHVVVGHRRGQSLWPPLIVFVALLVAGAVVGSVIVPGAGPSPGAAPRPNPAATLGPTSPSGSLTPPARSTLPTTPARPADALAGWAGRVSAAVGIPVVALQAYGYAQLSMQAADPACHLSWTTLAGIGELASSHGQVSGAVLQHTGRSDPLIMGPAQDGQDDRALVVDTDAGAFDGDTDHDRSMGPLHLLPSVWRTHGIDADADGILDPHDLDDAALTLARLLCSGSEDLGQLPGWQAAVARYRAGEQYVRSVFTAADSYGVRTRNIG